MGQSKKDNPEKLATQGTQVEEKQNKNTSQYVLDTTICKQTQITRYSEPEDALQYIKKCTTHKN